MTGVRATRDGDAAAVAELHRVAFGDQGPRVAALVADLRASHPGAAGCPRVAVELVAETDGVVVGHVMLTWALLDAPRRLVDVLVLSPLAVAPPHQGRGTGSALVRGALAAAADGAAPAVFLEGDPAYYGRFGFVAGAGHGFRRPSLRTPPAGFQVVLLPGHEPWMTGTLVYPDPFWRHDVVGLRQDDGEADGEAGGGPGAAGAVVSEP